MSKILKLKDVRTPLPFTMNKGLSAFTVGDILRDRAYELDFDVYLPTKKMNLQRPLVWTDLQKQELVLSLLKGIEIPVMAMISYDHKIMRIIDGKQRLSAWIGFAKNEFPINVNGELYFFNNLDEDSKWAVTRTSVRADVAYEYPNRPISDEWKIKWFNLINFAGTPQDREHMQKLQSP